MSTLEKPAIVTEAEYLAMADASLVKLEFIGGVVYALDEAPAEGWIEGVVCAMAGAHPNHTTIPKNFDRAAMAALDARGCRGFDSDQRLKLDEYRL